MTRKRKDYRELKVSSFSGYGYKSAPMLRIQGLWLEELGFNIGDPILVKCEDGKLIITVDHAREDAETKHDLRRISERLSNLGIDYQQLDSDASIKKWNAGQLQVGLIHPASAGHGLNLQSGGNILVWFGITWSLELYQQTVARLWRQGQTEGTVSVIHIVTDGTVDERILKALEAKDLTQSALIDAVKAEVGDGK